MHLAYCMQALRPGAAYSANGEPPVITMQDGSTPPTTSELQTVWAQREAALQSAGLVKEKLANVMATFTAGQRVAYASAVDAVGNALDDADIASAKDIIATFPAVDEALRARLLACF